MDPMAGEKDRQYQPVAITLAQGGSASVSFPKEPRHVHRCMSGHTLTHPEGGLGNGVNVLECQLLYFHDALSRAGDLSNHHDGCYSIGRSTGELQHLHGS